MHLNSEVRDWCTLSVCFDRGWTISGNGQGVEASTEPDGLFARAKDQSGPKRTQIGPKKPTIADQKVAKAKAWSGTDSQQKRGGKTMRRRFRHGHRKGIRIIRVTHDDAHMIVNISAVAAIASEPKHVQACHSTVLTTKTRVQPCHSLVLNHPSGPF